MTNPLKVVITVVIIILIGVGFYFMSWQKKIQEIKKLDVEIKNQEAELDRLNVIVQEYASLVKQREELQVELQNKLKEKLSPEDPKDFVPNYLGQIEKLIAEVRNATGDLSFDVLSLTPGGEVGEQVSGAAPSVQPEMQGQPETSTQQPETKTPEETSSALAAAATTRTFDMTMKGRYNTLIYFLDQLGQLKLKRLVTISRIGLSPAAAGGPGISPVLSINLPIKAYLRKGGGR